MENELLDGSLPNEVKYRKRPVFILVLCILTWVGSLCSLISGLVILWSYHSTKEAMESFEMYGAVNKDFSNTVNMLFWSGSAYVLASLLCSFGALKMFKLKKIGFFVYLAGQLLSIGVFIFSTLIFMNNLSLFMGIGIFSAILSFFFPVAFVIMYATNLKYMK